MRTTLIFKHYKRVNVAARILFIFTFCVFYVSHMPYWLIFCMQQSAAFKILRTRLKTVPSYSFSGDQIKRTPSGNPYAQILQQFPSGLHISEDGDMNHDIGNSSSHNGINFAAKLQQFEQMQRQHRMHAKTQAQSRNTSTTSSKVLFLIII